MSSEWCKTREIVKGGGEDRDRSNGDEGRV